ncbi:MAG: permease [Chloroflexota bacterium]|nr:permease [Chloroflexota bacterium]
MDASTIILIIITIIVLIYALIRDETIAIDGIKLAGKTIWKNLLLLLTGFLLSGLVQVLLPQDLIASWLGKESGFKAVLIGCAAGGLIPGSPYAVFPIAAGFYKADAGLGAIIGFITAWSLWSLSRLPLEIALINPKAALIRYVITLFFPPLAGFIAQVMSKNLLLNF